MKKFKGNKEKKLQDIRVCEDTFEYVFNEHMESGINICQVARNIIRDWAIAKHKAKMADRQTAFEKQEF